MKAGGGKAALMWPLFGLLFVLALAGCGAESTVGAIQTVRDSIEHGTATAAGVRIDIATGQLDLTDGTDKLMEATFQYNVPGSRPEINYDANRTPGTLSIVQPVDRNNLPPLGGSTVNDWEIRLGNRLSLDLDMRLGLGDARIDLSNLEISGLRMNLGAGNVEADLSGDYRSNVDAHITGGLGNLTLKLGDRMSTRVTVTGGLGKVTAHGLSTDGEAYTNGIQSLYALDVTIESGMGEITLEGR
ncbi:MAG: toast rack family protein [Chloroflexota bacterium]|nr:toast rack family protein [Chloroflexota bacterium]MDQ5866502.1 toast rack family protein [Chloroflexota bacterium]